MKIAICLSGQYRTHDLAYDMWKNTFYSKYDCDVFLHTWDINGKRINYDGTDFNATEDLSQLIYSADEIRDKFSYKSVVVESYDSMKETFLENSSIVREKRNMAGLGHLRITHIYSMWYKALECFSLMEKYAIANEVKYDLIIKSRPDVLPYPDELAHLARVVVYRNDGKFNIHDANEHGLTIPSYNETTEPHDYFAIGKFDEMKKYCELYSYINELSDIISIEDFINPHSLLYRYLEYRKLNYNVVTNFLGIQR